MTRMPDICAECAVEAGTPWPVGTKAPYTGPCHWCGRSDVALMPFADLEPDFPEVRQYA